jgi:hypothetical protein
MRTQHGPAPAPWLAPVQSSPVRLNGEDSSWVGSAAMPLKAPSPLCQMLAPRADVEANQKARASEVAGVSHQEALASPATTT